MIYDKLQIDHYDKVARKFKLSKFSTMADEFIRDSETKFILHNIKKNFSILDIGCGNGFTLKTIYKKKKACKLYGIENNLSLYNLAKKNLGKKAKIIKYDIRKKLSNYKNFFDIIICQRVLINLMQEKDQRQALSNILYLLKRNGKLITIEGFQSGLENLNSLRKKLKLKTIQVAYHNLNLRDSFFKRKDLKNITPKDTKNFLSKNYFISRVLDPIYNLAFKKKFKYNSDFTKILSEIIPNLDLNIGQLKFLIFKKI
jgi:ubiquinone/menaquinone biosynthesis C-methylase UbiE